MRLTLTNGYPFPYPEGISDAESDAIADDASEYSFELANVFHFEMKHTITVEFLKYEDFEAARKATGWRVWGDGVGGGYVLEAKHSSKDGYAHPAIIVGDRAYCGFILEAT